MRSNPESVRDQGHCVIAQFRRTRIGILAMLGAAACLTQAGSTGAEAPSPRPQPVPVILLTVDTLRADHLPFYGYQRATAPHLAELAKESVVFERAFTPRGKTSPAYASMLTGTYPYRNGVTKLGMRLPGVRKTLAELLSQQDYRTAAFVSSTVMKNTYSNFAQGFEVYNEKLPTNEHDRAIFERKADRTAQVVLEWLAESAQSPDRDKAPFVFVHWIDPHGPYMAPERAGTVFKDGPRTHELTERDVPKFQAHEGFRFLGEYVDAYDTEIAFVDEAIGDVIAELKARKLYDGALIIFTADHGEALGENDVYFRHGWRLHDADTRVPLLIKPPGGRDGKVAAHWSGAVSLVDVLPTVMDYVGAPAGQKLDGISLKPIVDGRGGDEDRAVFSDRGPGNVRHLAAHHAKGSLLATKCHAPDADRIKGCLVEFFAESDPGQKKPIRDGEFFDALHGPLTAYADAIATHKPDVKIERRFSANDFRHDREEEGASETGESPEAKSDEEQPTGGKGAQSQAKSDSKTRSASQGEAEPKNRGASEPGAGTESGSSSGVKLEPQKDASSDSPSAPEVDDLSDGERDALRALGYID